MSARLAAALLLALALGSGPAAAQSIDVLGAFDDWTAYRTDEGGKPVCYIASQPKKDEGKYTRRGDIYAMVTHRPGANAFDVVSIHAGYTYKKGSSVEVEIGGRKFALFTHEDTAWATDASDDSALVKAMRAGRDMVVRGISSRGTNTKDTYSLIGFTAAHRAIDQACNAP